MTNQDIHDLVVMLLSKSDFRPETFDENAARNLKREYVRLTELIQQQRDSSE